MKNCLHYVCLLALLVLPLLTGCTATTEPVPTERVLTSAPTETEPNFLALFSTQVNGIRYYNWSDKYAGDEQSLAEYYLGDVIGFVHNQKPKEDFYSNCMPIGTRIYQHPDDVNAIIMFQTNEDDLSTTGYICVIEGW